MCCSWLSGAERPEAGNCLPIQGQSSFNSIARPQNRQKLDSLRSAEASARTELQHASFPETRRCTGMPARGWTSRARPVTACPGFHNVITLRSYCPCGAADPGGNSEAHVHGFGLRSAMTSSFRRFIFRYSAITLISVLMAAVTALASADATTRQVPVAGEHTALSTAKSVDGSGRRDPVGDRGANRNECDDTDLETLTGIERGDGHDRPPTAGIAAASCLFDMASMEVVSPLCWSRLESALQASPIQTHVQARAPPAGPRSAPRSLQRT